MTLSKFSVAVLLIAVLGLAVRAEEAAKPDAPKPVEPPKAAETKPEEAKPKTDGDLPKAPVGLSPINAATQNEALIGEVSKGAPEMKAKKAAKLGINQDALLLHVGGHADAGKGNKGDKGAKRGTYYTLIATGDVLAQLSALAEKHAHIKVTGALSGDILTVKEVSEAPVDPNAPPEKKKKKNA